MIFTDKLYCIEKGKTEKRKTKNVFDAVADEYFH